MSECWEEVGGVPVTVELHGWPHPAGPRPVPPVVLEQDLPEVLELARAGCENPARCRGRRPVLGRRAQPEQTTLESRLAQRLDRSVPLVVTPACPVSVLLHALRDAPVCASGLAVLAAAGQEPDALSPAEQADLLRASDRAATWATTRTSDLAAHLTAAVPALTAPPRGGQEQQAVLVARPGLAEVAVALHAATGTARWRVDTHTALARRAPHLLAALRSVGRGSRRPASWSRAAAAWTIPPPPRSPRSAPACSPTAPGCRCAAPYAPRSPPGTPPTPTPPYPRTWPPRTVPPPRAGGRRAGSSPPPVPPA